MRSSLTTLLALLAALPSAAQPQLISDHPAVKAAVEQFMAEQTVQTAVSAKKPTGARFAMANPYGGGYQLQTPPVALRLNRNPFCLPEFRPERQFGRYPCGFRRAL
jgi:hypothetical protein